MNKLKAAVIGCGNISARHLSALKSNPHIDITAVCDIDMKRADMAAEQYHTAVFYNIEDLFEHGDFDVLHICTPHYLHADMALAAIQRGKHVLCEKPLAVHYEDALKMCDAAENNHVTLGVCFQNRYNPASVHIKNLLQSGELGAVQSLKGFVTWDRDESYYNADDWHGTLQKEGGGVVINQSIHTLDLLQWFTDAQVDTVSGSISQKRLAGKVETEDTADALIKFKNGVTALFYGTLCFTRNSPVFIEICCEKGRIVLYDDLTVFRQTGHKEIITFEAADGEKSYWGKSHKLLIDDFYQSVLHQAPFAVSGEEGLNAVKIVDFLYRSARNQSISS